MGLRFLRLYFAEWYLKIELYMSMNEKIPGWGIVLILVFCIGAGWVVFNKFASSGVHITIAVIISIIVAIAIYEQLKSS